MQPNRPPQRFDFELPTFGLTDEYTESVAADNIVDITIAHWTNALSPRPSASCLWRTNDGVMLEPRPISTLSQANDLSMESQKSSNPDAKSGSILIRPHGGRSSRIVCLWYHVARP